jgi:hypothetical protein
MFIKYVYLHLPSKGPTKLTQFWIFGLKTNHLATLSTTSRGPTLSRADRQRGVAADIRRLFGAKSEELGDLDRRVAAAGHVEVAVDLDAAATRVLGWTIEVLLLSIFFQM